MTASGVPALPDRVFSNVLRLAWLDYGESSQRKALELMELFRERGTIDQLGLGIVRDTFSELLFPGTSTIQTRAAYFLFVPWVYLDLERRRVPSARAAGEGRRMELALAEALARSEDREGIIGIEVGRALKRLPSSIYWHGLAAWGIRAFRGSRDAYHRSLDVYYRLIDQRRDDGDIEESRTPRNWHVGIPGAPRGFLKTASLRLRRRDAEYLRERILTCLPRTYLAFLVGQGRPFRPTEFPWQHPQYGEVPAHLREQLEHARNFSEVVHGAALLYNLMLAEKVEEGAMSAEARTSDAGAVDAARRPETYRERLERWAVTVEARRDELAAWDRERFWSLVRSAQARVPVPTRRFVEAWVDLTLAEGGPRAALLNPEARQLIHQRERAIKGARAKLDNRRALELWAGEAGTSQFNYRWPVAQRIVLDILRGLARPNDA